MDGATRTVRIHADRDAIPPGAPHFVLLDPFWGPGRVQDLRSPTAGRYDRWARVGGEVYELAPLEGADVVVLPAAWEHYAGRPDAEERARAFEARALDAGKPLVVFFWSGSTEPVPLRSAHVFRTSLYRSTRGEREEAMPALSTDVVEHHLDGRLVLREWRERPVVGFCGVAPAIEPRRPRDLARSLYRRLRGVRLEKRPPSVRARAARALRACAAVETNFVFRSTFWAGAVSADGTPDYARMRATRDQFVRNLVRSDYVLAPRGGGNFSYRLYEAMSAGRIPLFVNTDSVLPLEDEIDWRSLCVWVEEEDLSAIGERVAAFHRELGPEGYAALQRRCRDVWLEKLSTEGFFRTIAPRLLRLSPARALAR